MSELTLREYRPGDEPEILSAFNRIFATVDPTFTPRSEALWRWQFLANPSGSLVLLAVTDEGRVAGQLANVLQRVWLEGRLVTFSQAVDSMSDPALRRGLRKESLQARLGNAYAERWAGDGPDQHHLLWGAPVRTAWRVGKTFIRYEIVRTQLQLVAPPGSIEVDAPRDVEVEVVPRVPLAIADLFERVRDRRGAIAVRDEPQVNWRFADHPERAYELALARRGSDLVGFTVYRKGSFDTREDQGLVCDWLVPDDDEGARTALLAWLRERACATGAARLCALFPDTAPEWLAFQDAGFRAEATSYAFVGRECVPGYDMRWMHAHWYYTLGDTDLV